MNVWTNVLPFVSNLSTTRPMYKNIWQQCMICLLSHNFCELLQRCIRFLFRKSHAQQPFLAFSNTPRLFQDPDLHGFFHLFCICNVANNFVFYAHKHCNVALFVLNRVKQDIQHFQHSVINANRYIIQIFQSFLIRFCIRGHCNVALYPLPLIKNVCLLHRDSSSSLS